MKAYRCEHCCEVYDDVFTAERCCAPHVVTIEAWQCPCGRLNECEDDAADDECISCNCPRNGTQEQLARAAGAPELFNNT